MPTKNGEFNISDSKCGETPTLVIKWNKFYTFTMEFKNGSQWEVSSLSFTAVTKDNPIFMNKTSMYAIFTTVISHMIMEE